MNEWKIGVVGHDYALVRLYWAGNNLGSWIIGYFKQWFYTGETILGNGAPRINEMNCFINDTPRHRIDPSTCWSVVQHGMLCYGCSWTDHILSSSVKKSRDWGLHPYRVIILSCFSSYQVWPPIHVPSHRERSWWIHTTHSSGCWAFCWWSNSNLQGKKHKVIKIHEGLCYL